MSTRQKWGIYKNSLALSEAVGTTDVIRVVGFAFPAARTLADDQAEVFPWDDDGLIIEREAILRYRVAAAVAETLVMHNPQYERLAYSFMHRADSRERDLHAISDALMIAEKDRSDARMKIEDLND